MLRVAETVIESLGGFVDALTPRDVDARSGRRRRMAVYRGCHASEHQLSTTLDRLDGGRAPEDALELHLFRAFARYARPFLPSMNEWEMLVSAQHHGVPTRLLDWTSSVLVAVHFATLRNEGEGAVVWQLDWQRVHRRFALPEIAFSIAEVERHVGASPFANAAAEGDRVRPLVCLLEPPSIEPRIIAQAGSFTYCTEAGIPLDRFLDRHGLLDALTRFVIEPDTVPLIRDQLDLIGIDERRLFPDIDGVAAAIRRYYS